jgi:hypothetical protein
VNYIAAAGLRIPILAFSLLLGGTVYAAEAPAACGPDEREAILSSRCRGWGGLSPQEKRDVRDNFDTWRRMPLQRKHHLRACWRHFRHLSPWQQQCRRDSYARWHAMPPEKRQLLRERYKRWQQLSPEQKLSLRRKYASPGR